MAPLNRKLARDILHRWMQVLAIALVMSCGVSTIVAAVGAYRSLSETRDAFYERYRFGTVFATATKAPRGLQHSLSGIEGVSAVELRVVKSIVIDVEGMAEPAGGVAISLPSGRDAAVNGLYLRSGRWPDPERSEIAVLESEIPEAEIASLINMIFDLKVGDLNSKRATRRQTGIIPYDNIVEPFRAISFVGDFDHIR